jgi:hypothetical protein
MIRDLIQGRRAATIYGSRPIALELRELDFQGRAEKLH